ncbi:MAG TPA: type II secretion system protein GspC [Polyangia bacterium]|nr:type II secretion system protein GspC [Polyangia bacterium]
MTRALTVLLFVSSIARADLTVVNRHSPQSAAPRDACPRERGFEIQCRGHHCDVERAFLDRVMENLSSIATCARIVPSLVDGRPLGFKLYAIRPQSLFARLLLRNGDRIETINGMDLTSPDKALEVYTRLRAADNFVVALERRGEALTLDYSIR